MFFLCNKRVDFSGPRGTVWRLLGVRRSPKNPNICSLY